MRAHAHWLATGLFAWLAATSSAAEMVLRFRTEQPGHIFINLYRPDGSLLRTLADGERKNAGEQSVIWDGRDAAGQPVPAGEYHWRGLFHEGVDLNLRGWIPHGTVAPWPASDGRASWGGDAGEPSAVAADAAQVYLGWALADRGNAVVACDEQGRVRWSHRRAEGPSGCALLAVEGGLVYVLGGLAGIGAEGGTIYRLDAKTGAVVPWPDGRIDLKIAAFWPADARTRPPKADGMAVRHERIYLTFTSSEFLAVLDAKTGAYLQTVVGAPPGAIDVAPTKTDLPDAPGKLIDADFAVIALGGGVLGKVLFAHDPLWVITSELSPIQRDVRISALTVIGDVASTHRHTAFVGFGAPLHQVQARPLLEIENVTWTAGTPGGRPFLGPWRAEALRAVRGVTLDAAGNLWVAEGDAFPKRFSVWDTNGAEGKLVREFFGPADTGALGGAINPLAPDLIFAQGCEWRIDAQTGVAQCLGVVTREPVKAARFGVGENGRAYLVVGGRSPADAEAISIFERLGDGHYRLRARFFAVDRDGVELTAAQSGQGTKTFFWADENDDEEAQPHELHAAPTVLSFATHATLPDLTLHGFSAESAVGWKLKVHRWTACDAPVYDFSAMTPRPPSAHESADGKLQITINPDPRGNAQMVCADLASGRRLWARNGFAKNILAGAARLPAPAGNVWLLADAASETAVLMNEDGFALARFPKVSGTPQPWPATATPGMSMADLPVAIRAGSLTHAVDGKLYLQAGETAYWNLEIAGLQKIRPLPGGNVTQQ